MAASNFGSEHFVVVGETTMVCVSAGALAAEAGTNLWVSCVSAGRTRGELGVYEE